MNLFEKPLEELKSFFNLTEPMAKSIDNSEAKKEEEPVKKSLDEEEEKKKKKKDEEEETEKSFDANAFFAKVDELFKSVQAQIDTELKDLKKSVSENNNRTDEGFGKLVKSFEDITKSISQNIEETKTELNKSLESVKSEFDARLKKLEDTPKMQKSVQTIERFKNEGGENGEELSKSVVSSRLTALFKKGLVDENAVLFWDANKKHGLKVLPENIRKAVLEYKD